MTRHAMTLEQVRSLVQALVSNYNLPADRGEVQVSAEGAIYAFCRLGPTPVSLDVRVTQESNGRFTCKAYSYTGNELLNNMSALVGLLEGFVALEAYLQKILRCLTATSE